MTEEEHDELVAKPLAEIMKTVAEKGGSLLAYSSFLEAEGERGFTFTGHAPNATAHEIIIELAIRTKGNLDRMLMEIIRMHKAGRIDASTSIFLQNHLEPTHDQ